MNTMSLPVLSTDTGLAHYLEEIKHFPMLSAEEEQDLAQKWYDNGDIDAAHTLVTSHLRLVTKIAMGFRGYGLPVMDLIAEGNIGLMQAVKRFNPTKGFRLSTYAMWWIKASIQEYVLKSWSLVKVGTTAAQKKLFFNLRKIKSRLGLVDDKSLSPEHTQAIANELDVSESEVHEMDMRLAGGDHSLNAPIYNAESDHEAEHIDFLSTDEQSHDVILAESQEAQNRQALLVTAMEALNDRERDIITRRRLKEDADTLEALSQEYGVSRERVRQIEARAMEKLQEFILERSAA